MEAASFFWIGPKIIDTGMLTGRFKYLCEYNSPHMIS